MNCQELEPVLSDLARSQMMDASVRERALSHTESCDSCKTRLVDERALAAGLKSLAASFEAEQAPARVEETLVAAFRKQGVTSPVRTSIVARRWFYIAASVAAAAVIVILLSLTSSRTRQAQPRAQESTQATPIPAAPELATPPLRAPESPAVIESRNYPAATVVKNPSRHKRRPKGAEQSPVDVEIATDFIPMMHGESLSQLEAGQLVRVALPRSALISFGLPMNMDRANEPIKADVVFGNDGLARAIRFVR